MKKINFPFKTLVIVAALNASASFAQNYQNKLGCLGLNFLYSTMKMNKEYGGNIFAKSAPGVGVSFSREFHEYFGAEIGYEMTKRKTKDTTITDTQMIYGVPALDPPELYRTSIKKTKPYVGITSTLSISNYGFVQLLVGGGIVKVKSYSILVRDKDQVFNDRDDSNKSKFVPTLKFSAGANVFNELGLKAFLSWDNTKKIKRTRGSFFLELKDTVNFGVGLIYHL